MKSRAHFNFIETETTVILGDFEIMKKPPKFVDNNLPTASPKDIENIGENPSFRDRYVPPKLRTSCVWTLWGGEVVYINEEKIYVVRHPLSPGWIWVYGELINRDLMRHFSPWFNEKIKFRTNYNWEDSEKEDLW